MAFLGEDAMVFLRRPSDLFFAGLLECNFWFSRKKFSGIVWEGVDIFAFLRRPSGFCESFRRRSPNLLGIVWVGYDFLVF